MMSGHGADDDMRKSMINDIRSFFTSISLPKGMGVNPQHTQMLHQQDQRDIRKIFVRKSLY